MRPLCGRLRTHARRDGRGDLHRDATRAQDRGTRSECASDLRVLPPDVLEFRDRPSRQLRADHRGNHPRFGGVASWREGHPVDADPGGIPDRLRTGDACGAVPRREGGADARASERFDCLQQGTSTDRNHAATPGPLRLSLENRANVRVLPGVWIAGETLHSLLGKRKPFLTAKRLLTNQTFRDVYGTETLDVDQRLNITSLTFLFTDLKGSTALYERVGDLVAYDLVRAHFHVLTEIVAFEAGAVVKTIGDAVMATFPTPDRPVGAALRLREA